MIDKLYELFEKSIPDYEGKICVPISGGLDSRVLAGLIAKKRKKVNQPIELSYCQFFIKHPVKLGTQIKPVKYARQIADICGVERFEPICVNYDTDEDLEAIKGLACEDQLKQSRMYTGVRILNEQVNLKDYTIISAHGPDSFTGIGVNPFTLFTYKERDIKTSYKRVQYFNSIFPGTYGAFAKWDCPVWGNELTEWCENLPLKYRFHQYLYRQMIKKYFPELAVIKREGMDVSMDIGEVRYFYERTKHWFNKKVKK